MAGKLSIDRLQLEISINGDPSRQEMARLETAVKNVQKEIRQIEKDGKKMQETKEMELAAVRKRYEELSAQIKETGKDARELGKDDPMVLGRKQLELKKEQLKAELAAMPNEKESKVAEKKAEINQLKTSYDGLRETIGLTGLSMKELRRVEGELSAVTNILPGNHEDYQRYQNDLAAVKRRIDEINTSARLAKIDMEAMNKEVSGSLSNVKLDTLSFNQLTGYKAKLETVFKDLAPTDAIFEKTKLEIIGVENELKKLNNVSLANIHAEIEKSIGNINISGMSLTGLGQYKEKLKTVFDDISPDHALFGKVSSELQAVNTQMNVLESGAKAVKEETGSMFGRMADGFNKFQGIALGAIAIFTGVAMSLKQMIDGAAKLSDEFVDIQQQTGMTAKQVELLNEKFKYFNTRSANSQLREISTEAGSLGVAKNQIAEFTEKMNMLFTVMGKRMGGSAKDVTITFGKLRNTFKDIKSDNVADDILKIGNAIDMLVKNGVASAPIITDFAQRIGGVGISLGLSTTQVLGFSAALEEMSVNPEIGGTAVTKILQKMTTNTAEFARIAGISVQDFSHLVNTDLAGAFELVVEKSQKSKPSAMALAAIMKDLEVSAAGTGQVFTKLGQNTDMLREKIAMAEKQIKNSDSITESYNLRNNNLAGNLEKIGKWLAGIFVNSSIMKGMEWFVNAWAKWTEKDPTEMLEKEKNEVNELASQLMDVNLPLSVRNKLYNELKDLAPQVIGNMTEENLNIIQLTDNLEAYNKQMVSKIFLAGEEKKLSEARKETSEKLGEYLKAEKTLAQAKLMYEKDLDKLDPETNKDLNATFTEENRYAILTYKDLKRKFQAGILGLTEYVDQMQHIEVVTPDENGDNFKHKLSTGLAAKQKPNVATSSMFATVINDQSKTIDQSNEVENRIEEAIQTRIKYEKSLDVTNSMQKDLNELTNRLLPKSENEKKPPKKEGNSTVSGSPVETNEDKYAIFLAELQMKNKQDRERALAQIEVEEKKNLEELKKLEKVKRIGKKGSKTKGGIGENKDDDAKSLITNYAVNQRLKVKQEFDLKDLEEAHQLKTAQLELNDATAKELLKNQLEYEKKKLVILQSSGIKSLDETIKIAKQQIEIQKTTDKVNALDEFQQLEKKRKADQEAANVEIRDKKELARRLLEIDLSYDLQRYKLLKDKAVSKESEGGVEITDEEQKRINELFNKISEEQKKLKHEKKKENIMDLMGINPEDQDNLKQVYGSFKNLFESIEDLRIRDIEKQQAHTEAILQAYEQESSALEGKISEAKQQQEKGHANNLQSLTAQKAMKDQEIAALKKQKQQEADELKRAQNTKNAIQSAEMIGNSVMQISNLITASTKVFAADSGVPFIGTALALAAIAEMFVAMTSMKSLASSLAFYEGTESVPLGTNPKGRDTIPARLHEGERVVPTALNEQLKGVKNSDLPKLVNAGKIALTRPLPLSHSLIQYHIHVNNSDQVKELKAMNSHLATLVDAQLNREEHHALANGQLLHIVYVNGKPVQKTFIGGN